MGSYTGSLAFEENEWRPLTVERWIVAACSVSFTLSGHTELGHYSVGGEAASIAQGRFEARGLIVRNRDTGEEFAVDIVLTCVAEAEDGCAVAGEWWEERKCYPFDGELEPFCG